MKAKKLFYLIGLFWGISLLVCLPGWAQPAQEMKGPVITSAFAVQQQVGEQYYGSVWKIYVEAKALDGDMAKIGVRVNQAGHGSATDWIALKPRHRNQFKGYLQWDTAGSRDGAQITLEIFVIDRAGDASKEARFRLVCSSGSVDHSRPGCLLDQSEPPAPFDQGDVPRIGHININLTDFQARFF